MELLLIPRPLLEPGGLLLLLLLPLKPLLV